MKKVEYAISSAVYHAVKGNIFLAEDGLAYKIKEIYKDENSLNKKIQNENRLKKRLFNIIMNEYNERIYKLKLTYRRISSGEFGNFDIIKYKFVDNDEKYSGKYFIYPKSFVCSKCGDFVYLDKDKLQNFKIKRCRDRTCNGEYEQVSILLFCEKCGIVKEFKYSCKGHKLKLIRPDKDSIRTWRIKCLECEKKKEIDPFRFMCDHKDKNGNYILNDKKEKYTPVTVKEGKIFHPVIITCIDLPKLSSFENEDFEYILLGLTLNKFQEIAKIKGKEVTFQRIHDYIERYNNQTSKEDFFDEMPQMQISDMEKEKKWREKNFIHIIEKSISELKDKYKSPSVLEQINDFHAIKGNFSLQGTQNKNLSNINQTYLAHIEKMLDTHQKEKRMKEYDWIKQRFGIKEITYIPKIDVISSCIGLNIGPVTSTDMQGNNGKKNEYHFEPFWKNDKQRKELICYSYPFETEGILFELDKIKICNWLINNKKLDKNPPLDEGTASEILMNLDETNTAYDAMKALIHTLSHILIRRSSIYTGLDSDSCRELLFVNCGAFLIYQSSSIDVGGLEYVFEHLLLNWFKDVELEIKECTNDPACIYENGACYACMYLPEYVCSHFNSDLDRDVFVGSRRYKHGFLKETPSIPLLKPAS